MIDYQFQSKTSSNPSVFGLFQWAGKYWFQIIVSFFLLSIYSNRNIQLLVVPPNGTTSDEFSVLPAHLPATEIVGEGLEKKDAEPIPKAGKAIENKWKPSDFRNLSFILSPNLAERKGVPPEIEAEKMRLCKDYVERFSQIAITEMEKFGIPASITLAQGLLETDAGGSRLASESNNHFGIKCRSKCRGCTCRNYSDDDIYDMFRVFDSAWESYREHSNLLQMDRYKHLKKLGKGNYEAWATGLKKAGYATDPNYHKKLVRIIKVLDLDRFDE